VSSYGTPGSARRRGFNPGEGWSECSGWRRGTFAGGRLPGDTSAYPYLTIPFYRSGIGDAAASLMVVPALFDRQVKGVILSSKLDLRCPASSPGTGCCSRVARGDRGGDAETAFATHLAAPRNLIGELEGVQRGRWRAATKSRNQHMEELKAQASSSRWSPATRSPSS